MRRSRRARRVSLITFVVAVSVLLAFQGCKTRGGEGPMERGGRAMDRAGEKIGDAFRR